MASIVGVSCDRKTRAPEPTAVRKSRDTEHQPETERCSLNPLTIGVTHLLWTRAFAREVRARGDCRKRSELYIKLWECLGCLYAIEGRGEI